MKGWQQIPIAHDGPEHNEPLVPLGMLSDFRNIFTDSMYFGERHTSPYKRGELAGATVTCFVRFSLAMALEQASTLLPPNHAFVVWDAYRPEQVQKSLYEDFCQKLVAECGYTKEEAAIKAPEFVSIPSTDPAHPSPHITGGSIDLGIVEFDDASWLELRMLDHEIRKYHPDDKNVDVCLMEMHRQQIFREKSVLLDSGVDFDEVSPKTALRYYEELLEQGKTLSPPDTERLMNRRMMHNALNAAGFASYPHEPWHLDLGNQFWAHQKGGDAFYGPTILSAENLRFEADRRAALKMALCMNFRKSSLLAQRSHIANPVARTMAAIPSTARFGHPMNPGSHPRGSRLEATALNAA